MSMSTRAAIAASIAYDTIMVFEGQFTDHILPDQIHKINLSFLSPKMRREYGGCAGNIAYNYALLGGEAVPMGMVGDDFGPYLEHVQRQGIDASCLVQAKDSYTAQCFIVTDLHNNQLAGFHPGAMGSSAQIPVAQAGAVACGLVGPDAKDAMQWHTQQMTAAGVPFVLDPGQNIVLFSGPELLELIDQAPVLVCNDYEAELVVRELVGDDERGGSVGRQGLEQAPADVQRPARAGERGPRVHPQHQRRQPLGSWHVALQRRGHAIDPLACPTIALDHELTLDPVPQPIGRGVGHC